MAEIYSDIVIIGGGMAGVCSAISARRQKVSVVLVERANLLGGCSTLAMVQPWQGFFTAGSRENPSGRQIIFGIAQEIVNELVELGASAGHIPDPIGFAGSITPINPAVLSAHLVHKLHSEGVTLLLGARLIKVKRCGSSITSVFCECGEVERKEILEIRAKVYIDASGGSALFRLAGEELIVSEKPQAWTHIFTLAPVDEEEVRDYIYKHPKDFVLAPNWKELISGFTAVSGFFSLVKKAREAGKFPCPRDRLLFFGGAHKGEITVNTTRVFPPKGYFRKSAKEQEIISAKLKSEGLLQVYELTKFMRERVPGFKHSELHQLAPEIGIRESYRLRGRATLRGRDVIFGRMPRDCIALGGYPIDIHVSGSSALRTNRVGGDGIYGIPLGALLPRNIANAVAAGRIISADSQAFASSRITATVMSVGESGGRIAVKLLMGEKLDTEEILGDINLGASREKDG